MSSAFGGSERKTSPASVDSGQALLERGQRALEAGRLDEALAAYELAAKLQPEGSEAHLGRANLLLRLGRLDEAAVAYHILLAHNPHTAAACFGLGAALFSLGRPAEALERHDQAIALQPQLADAHVGRALALKALGQPTAALACYDRALEYRPDSAETHFNRANLLASLGRIEEALRGYEAASGCRAPFPEAEFNRGNVLRDVGRFEEALHAYNQAVTLRPSWPQAHANRAVVQHQLGRFDEAYSSNLQALALEPAYAEACSNLGTVMYDLGLLDGACASFRQALAIRPQFGEARYALAMAQLKAGDYVTGWAGYEWRLHETVRGRRYRLPRFGRPWRGAESLAGRSILLFAEQGLGDTLQFCRYVPLVAALGARAVVQVPESLERLLATLEGVAQVVPLETPPPACDYHCPLMSLPLAFGTTIETVPVGVPYLKSDPQIDRHWSQRLGERSGPRVGLVWSSGFRPNSPERWSADARRNIPLAKLRLLDVPDVDFISLQKGEPAQSELSTAIKGDWDGPKLRDFAAELHDFADTAALVGQLDLVISVCTATAHLAGAIGKPVWLLNRYDTCWRWLLGRDDSPWYPTVRIYRQPRPGDWESVLTRVRADLQQFTQRRVAGVAAV